jgi:hypothetical protein
MATYIKAVCAECSSSLPCGGCPFYCATQSWIADSGNLPSAVNFYGTSLSLSGTSYGNTTNGVILEGSVWAVYRSGVRTTQGALMSENITDYFNSTYTLSLQSTSDPSENVTVTLTRSGCMWIASQTIGTQNWTFNFSLDSACGMEGLGWTILGVVPASPLGNLFIVYKLDEDGIPITQGTPVGSYAIGTPRWDVYTIS